LQHPAIAECAVLGLPDKEYGEVMCVVVVVHEQLAAEASKKGEPAITLPELTKWAKTRMAPYKVHTL
jgi:malonyl-CoA/methylmalonyl-CoA synthetase